MVLVPLRTSPPRGIVAPLGGLDTFCITLLGTLTRLTADYVSEKEFYSILQATEDWRKKVLKSLSPQNEPT